MLPSLHINDCNSHNPDTYPMHECLRVEKLPCIFLEKRESLFIMLPAGQKRVELSSEKHQNSSSGRRGINKVNFCGATKTPMLSWIREKSCLNSFYVICGHKLMAPGERSLWEDGAGKTGPRTTDAKQRQDAKQQNKSLTSCTWWEQEWKWACRSGLLGPLLCLLDKTY